MVIHHCLINIVIFLDIIVHDNLFSVFVPLEYKLTKSRHFLIYLFKVVFLDLRIVPDMITGTSYLCAE